MKRNLSISLLYPAIKTITSKGLDYKTFLYSISLPLDILQRPELLITEKDMDCYIEAAAKFTSDDHFGLHQGELIELSSLGILGYVLMNAKNLMEVIENYQRYHLILCNGIDIQFEMINHEANFYFSSPSSDRIISRHIIEGMMSSLFVIFCSLSCKTITINEISFQHASLNDDMTEYKRILGNVPKFSQATNKLSFRKNELEYPVLMSNPELFRTFEIIAQEALLKHKQGRYYTDQVYKFLIYSIKGKTPTIHEVAKYLGFSVRNLQLKLKSENNSFSTISNEVRKNLAIHYLHNQDYTISEIAFLLGFSEPSSFQNAFKKWMGMTPGEFRSEKK